MSAVCDKILKRKIICPAQFIDNSLKSYSSRVSNEGIDVVCLTEEELM